MSEAIEAAWPICIGPLQGKKGAMTHEDHITVHLVQALRRTKKVPGRIEYQHELLVEDANGNVSLSSSIDFVLTVGDDEDVYLAYECKRLNVPYAARVRNLCVPYVQEGLMRFVTGQYSNGLPMATMIGYLKAASRRYVVMTELGRKLGALQRTALPALLSHGVKPIQVRTRRRDILHTSCRIDREARPAETRQRHDAQLSTSKSWPSSSPP